MDMDANKWEPVNHADVARIVGRLHVGQSYREAVRAVLEKSTVPFKRWPKTHRRYLIAAVIQHHGENRRLYGDVMRGTPGESDPPPRYFFRRADNKTIIKEDAI